MAIAPTRYSRVSTGFVSSNQSITDVDAADTGNDFSCINGAATGSFSIGGGAALAGVSTVTASFDFGSLAGLDSSSTTVALAGAAVGDPVLLGYPSNYSGAYYDLDFTALCNVAGVATLKVTNSAATAIDPGVLAFRFTAINYDSFV